MYVKDTFSFRGFTQFEVGVPGRTDQLIEISSGEILMQLTETKHAFYLLT